LHPFIVEFISRISKDHNLNARRFKFAVFATPGPVVLPIRQLYAADDFARHDERALRDLDLHRAFSFAVMKRGYPFCKVAKPQKATDYQRRKSQRNNA
jgi:hypothetical protein